jgi:hypothetical protein
MRPNGVSYKVIGASMNVHTALGPGCLESAYDKCLGLEFARIGLQFQHQVRVPVIYEGAKIPAAYSIDYVVEKCHKLGLLLNFKVPHMREGIHRIINGREGDL